MKRLFVFLLTICQFEMAFSQRREALIAPIHQVTTIFEPRNMNDNIVKGIIRLRFVDEHELKVTKTELIYLSVADSTTNVKSLEYQGGTWVIYDRRRAKWYRNNLDSIFRNLKYEIINKDYQVFISKGDFSFSFALQRGK